MIYFTADTHFFHSNIIGMSRRPFTDVSDMNKTLITNWNAMVRERDEVYHLGDFAYKGSIKDVNGMLSKLNGKKYLIAGNHDGKYLNDSGFASAFDWVKDYYELSYKDARFILFHYPIFEWAHYYRKSVHLYGHVHNNADRTPEDAERFALLGNRAINVGVDCYDYYPVSIEVIYTKAFGKA